MIKFIIPIAFALLFSINKEDEINDSIIMFDEDIFKKDILESIHGFIEDVDIDSSDVYIPFQ